MSDLSEVKIFSGENSKYIAEKIAKSLNLDLGQKTLLHFSDGEFATLTMKQFVVIMFLSYNPLSRLVIPHGVINDDRCG